MKRVPVILLFFTVFLAGCGKSTAQTFTADFFTVSDGVTHNGVEVGDGKAAFTNAYSDYVIQVAYNDTNYSNYTVMSMKSIPFDRNISTLIASFFIDGTPMSEEEICKENQISAKGLANLLASPAYLRAHDVSYRYLRFTWEEGSITKIDSAELNFNESYDIPRME